LKQTPFEKERFQKTVLSVRMEEPLAVLRQRIPFKLRRNGPAAPFPVRLCDLIKPSPAQQSAIVVGPQRRSLKAQQVKGIEPEGNDRGRAMRPLAVAGGKRRAIEAGKLKLGWLLFQKGAKGTHQLEPVLYAGWMVPRGRKGVKDRVGRSPDAVRAAEVSLQ
jgi:hypothetical protein